MNELHKKVQVVVLHSKNNKINLLLLQTKADRGEFWQNVTGSIEGDESWEQGALRELEEETGLTGKLTLLELSYNFHDRWNRDVEEKVYLAQVESDQVKICDKEHQGFTWKDVEEVTNSDFGHVSNYESFIEATKCLK
jgi:dATP pyrophosphohydrolase